MYSLAKHRRAEGKTMRGSSKNEFYYESNYICIILLHNYNIQYSMNMYSAAGLPSVDWSETQVLRIHD